MPESTIPTKRDIARFYEWVLNRYSGGFQFDKSFFQYGAQALVKHPVYQAWLVSTDYKEWVESGEVGIEGELTELPKTILVGGQAVPVSKWVSLGQSPDEEGLPTEIYLPILPLLTLEVHLV